MGFSLFDVFFALAGSSPARRIPPEVIHVAKQVRADRKAGHRGAYEKARAKILATQSVCAICGKPVDKTLKSPHPLSATVDHIIPINKGGHPSDISNLQLAHRCCNREKSDKILKQSGHDVVEKPISNRVLPLARDWNAYKA
jgi:5-methylcytosine-specific restriction endonuclease McrA